MNPDQLVSTISEVAGDGTAARYAAIHYRPALKRQSYALHTIFVRLNAILAPILTPPH